MRKNDCNTLVSHVLPSPLASVHGLGIPCVLVTLGTVTNNPTLPVAYGNYVFLPQKKSLVDLDLLLAMNWLHVLSHSRTQAEGAAPIWDG